ncbi:YhbY family RNA-binding protein [Salinisphaera sp. USBA-960]|uniref:YhbY family RNA-binding protein n=1 Tax=Salinisphaera orenii TaxID=856731 RepID=UPI000DBE4A4B|nr:YhbY family RNA-binding protein [Salifodinibacter halophilus]NNC25530.1 YhbY family RNA-binding protein [Salifodinibacter halophilus]
MANEQQPDRRALKRRAHHLKPLVRAGAAGMSDAVVAELDATLSAHELVKIRVDAPDRATRRTLVDDACARVDAECVQRIGHTATLYRPNPDETADDDSP